MRRLLGLMGITLCVLCSTTLAQQKYELQRKAKEGEKCSFESSQNGKQVGHMGPQEMTQSMSMLRKGTFEVVAVANGIPTSLKISFDKECSQKMEMTGQQPMAQNFALAGETVTISRDPKGMLQHDYKGQLDQMAMMELNAYLEPPTAFLPPKPVAVGDTWEPDTRAATQMYQLGQGDQLKMTCKFVGVRDLGGRQVAEISSTMLLDKKSDPNQQLRNEVSGTSMVDIETGAVLQMEASGKMSSSMTQDRMGQRVTMTSEGTTEQRARITPLGAVAVQPPRVDPVNPVNPIRPAPAGTFAGTFKNDQLTVEIAAAGGAFAGTIKMGDQQLPVKATEAAGKLDGTFEAGGNPFKFTATLEGDTLVFTTDGTTHKLARQGAAKPKNPLER